MLETNSMKRYCEMEYTGAVEGLHSRQEVMKREQKIRENT